MLIQVKPNVRGGVHFVPSPFSAPSTPTATRAGAEKPKPDPGAILYPAGCGAAIYGLKVRLEGPLTSLIWPHCRRGSRS